MEDNSTEGRGVQWVKEAHCAFINLRSAGFHVLQHNCFSAHRFHPPPLNGRNYDATCILMQEVLGPFAAGLASFHAKCITVLDKLSGPSPIVCWFKCLSGQASIVVSHHFMKSYLYRGGSGQALLTNLLVGSCNCKCKSATLFQQAPSSSQVQELDACRWGPKPKLCTSTSTVLGFGLSGAPIEVDSNATAKVLCDAQVVGFDAKAKNSIVKKRSLFAPLRQSLPERAICCRAYLTSCLHYTQQIIFPNQRMQDSMLARNSKFVLGGRHWLASCHVTAVFRFFRLPQPGSWLADCPTGRLSSFCALSRDWPLRRSAG